MRDALRLPAAGLALSLLGIGVCAQESPDKPATPAAAARQEPAAATVDGNAILLRDVDEFARTRLFELRNQEYAARRQAVDELIARMLLAQEAKARGVSLAELERVEVEAKARPVSDAEARKLYDANKARLQGRSEAEGLALVTGSIKQDRLRERRTLFVNELRSKRQVRLLLDPPRLDIDLAGAPIRGPQQAPVTIVEFSDFQCPFCGQMEPVVKRVLDAYGDRVRLVYRDYPVAGHTLAPKASEAGSCAREQGKFWEMHDRLFANQGALQVADLKRHAAEIGLEPQRFDECLDSGKFASVWQRGGEDGNRYGLTGTPAFFVNGRLLSGIQTFERFSQLIDEELQRAGLTPPKPAPPAAAK